MSSASEDEQIDLDESLTESDSQQDNHSDSDEDIESDFKNVEELSEYNGNVSNEDSSRDMEGSEISSNGSDQEDDEAYKTTPNNDGAKCVEDTIRNEIIDRLKDRVGKQLYIRFKARLPENEAEFQKQAKALSPLITEAIKPRQKHARFCLVNFQNKASRDSALLKLREAIKKKDPAFKGILVSIPRTENESFVEELVQKKLKARDKKLVKSRLKRTIIETKKRGNKVFTSTVLIRNLPANVSKAEIRSLLPNAVDIQMKPCKPNKSSLATVTLPTSKDAREAVKQNLSLGGSRLRVTFHGGKIKRPSASHNNLRKSKQNIKKSETKTRKVLST